jgi:hypothetical protein
MKLLLAILLAAALGGCVGYGLTEAWGWWGLLVTLPAAFLIGLGAAEVADR